MNENVKKYIKEKLALVPTKPGSYQMKNKDGIIIYVGKAKNLKNRLKSYFTGTVTGKTLMLVNDIVDFEYIVTTSELESLILEIKLIKKYNPKYNILLKDDKTYPYIEVSSDKYPTVHVVRNINRKKNKTKNRLFGPFPNVSAARRTVEIINRIYPLRKCKNLGKEVCLYYHIGECLGYCSKKVEIDLNEIDKMKQEICSFLNGDHHIISKKLEKDMYVASENLNFERAKELKEMLDDINITLKKQRIDTNRNYHFDVFSSYREDNFLSIQVFFIRDGILFGRHSDIISVLDDEEERLLEYIVHFYDKNHLLPKELVVEEKIDAELISKYFGIKVTTPKKGDVKKLLEMANDNAKIALHEKMEILKKSDEERLHAQEELRQILHLNRLSRIEAFDNSHLFGTFYVGGMVVFDDFLPNKDLYRKYKISTEVHDDLAAMKEVLYRRYFKVLMEDEKAPDLIVVDGGEQQIIVAKEIINSLRLNIKIVGLKKDDKHRTKVLIDDCLEEIKIDSRSNIFVFLSKIQEEVHRFAITYHRTIKSQSVLASTLDFVPGIGKVKKKELLRKFGSMKKLKEASLEELETILNKTVAIRLYEYLKTI